MAAVTFDATNEQVVIRAAVADPNRRRALVHALSDSQFLYPFHAAAWRALRALADRGLEYTPDAMRQLIVAEGAQVDEDYLADEIEAQATVVQNLDWHVATLRWDATRANLIREGVPAFVKQLEDPRAPVEDVAAAARALLKSLEGGGGRRFLHRPEELARAYKAELRERRRKGNFWPSGFAAMDEKMTEGFMPRRTSVVTGLPGSGKSTFIMTLVIALAKLGRRPLMCCWEMPGISTLDVMSCAMTGLELRRVVQGTVDDEELRRLDRATDWLNTHVRFMDNAFFARVSSGKRSNERNQDILEGYVAEAGCDALVMDLWERCLVDLNPDAVALALMRQQQMHVEYNLHGFIIQQLRSKDVEKRTDKRPTRESIKGTGAYVEVADLIFGIHRDAQFKQVPDDAIEAICLKQRKGMPNWAVRFDWDGAHCRVSGGVEVPYDPGLESMGELGEVTDVSAIKARSGRSAKRIGTGRDA